MLLPECAGETGDQKKSGARAIMTATARTGEISIAIIIQDCNNCNTYSTGDDQSVGLISKNNTSKYGALSSRPHL
jgi:hypothetical protein